MGYITLTNACLWVQVALAKFFEKLSTALHLTMINKYNASRMSHLIDDFFFIGLPNSEKCLNNVLNFEKNVPDYWYPNKKI